MSDEYRELWGKLKQYHEIIECKIDDWTGQRDLLDKWLAAGREIRNEIVEQSRLMTQMQTTMWELVKTHLDPAADPADWWKNGPHNEAENQ